MNTTLSARATRGRRRPSAEEDYLEAILGLERGRGMVRVGELAAVLNVHKSTVTATLKALAARGLVTHQRYGGARLTPDGKAIAARTTTRHALIHDFLVRMLLLDDGVADAHACRMEHVVDPDVAGRFELLARFASRRPSAVRNWRRDLRAFIRSEGRRSANSSGGRL